MENKFSKLNKITQRTKKPFVLFSLILIVSLITPDTTIAFSFNPVDYFTNSPANNQAAGNEKVKQAFLQNSAGMINLIGNGIGVIDETRPYLQAGIDIVNNPLVKKTINAIDSTAIDQINGLGGAMDAGKKELNNLKGKAEQINSAIAYCGQAATPEALKSQCISKAIGDAVGLFGDIKALTGKGDIGQKIQAVQGILTRLSPLVPGLGGISGMLGNAGSLLGAAKGGDIAGVMQGVQGLFKGDGIADLAGKGAAGMTEALSMFQGANAGGAAAALISGGGAITEGLSKVTEGLAGAKEVAGALPGGQLPGEDFGALLSGGACSGGTGGAGAGGANGVPVIEQPGSLLTLTSQTKSLTSDNCKYLKHVDEMTTDIDKIQNDMWKKLTEGDPTKWQQSKDANKAAAEAFDKNLNTNWRSTSADYKANAKGEGKESANPTIEKYAREQETAARQKGLKFTNDLITENIQNPYVKKIYQDTLDVMKKRDDILSDDTGKAAFIAQNTPDETIRPLNELGQIKDRSYFTQITKHMDPVNNPIGVMMNMNAWTAMAEAKARDDAQKELMMGQGILGKKACTYEITFEGKKTCLEYLITQPAKFVADLGSFFLSAPAKMGAESKLQDEKSNQAPQESVQKATGQSGDSSDGSIGPDDIAIEKPNFLDQLKDVLKGVCSAGSLSSAIAENCGKIQSAIGTATGALNNFGSITKEDVSGIVNDANELSTSLAGDSKYMEIGNQIKDLSTNLNGVSEGGADSFSGSDLTPTDQGGSQVLPPVKVIPDPTVTFSASKTIDLGNGIRQATLSWSSDNAISCFASNNWLTFGDEKTPSIDSSVAVKNGDESGPSDKITITFPSLFTYAIDTSGGPNPDAPNFDITNPYSPQNITGGLFLDDNKNINQKATYKPNLNADLKGWDYLKLTLGNINITLNVGTDEDLRTISITDILSRFKQAINSKDSAPPRFTVDTTTDSLIITQKMENDGSSIRSADYSITCYNEAGKEVTATKKITFF